MNAKKRIAVIGAGIAGLTCAYELQKAGFEVVVYEKNAQVGGRMSSRVKEGFVFDLGADHLGDLYDHMKVYCKEFDIDWERMRFLKYGLSRNGEVLPIGDAVSRMANFRLALQYFFIKPVGEFWDLNELARYDHSDAYSYMRSRVGKEVTEYYVDAFTSTYQFHRAKEISSGAMFGIMYSIKKNMNRWYEYLFRTKGGMQALPDAFAKRLNVKLNHPVKELIAEENNCVVDGENFDSVVLASTANAGLSLYKNPTQKQKELLQKTKYAATISLAFKVDTKLLPDMAIVWVPFVESTKISGFVNESMKGEELTQDGKTLLCVWLHEDFAKSIMNKSDEEVYAQVKEELLKLCTWFKSPDELKDHDLERWPAAMPKFSHGHLSRVREFVQDGQGEQNVFFCGDYLNAPWTEGALRCGQRVAKQISEKLTA